MRCLPAFVAPDHLSRAVGDHSPERWVVGYEVATQLRVVWMFFLVFMSFSTLLEPQASPADPGSRCVL